MVETNFIALLVAALIPLITGFIWYNEKLFGKVWMREASLTEEQLKKFNMPLVFGITYILSFFVAFAMQFITVHQFGALGLIGGDVTLAKPSFSAFMNDYGNNFRSFGHGVLHAVIIVILLVFPIHAINGMFERKSWKYIFINTGYWLITLMLMGGIVCGWYDFGHFDLVTPK